MEIMIQFNLTKQISHEGCKLQNKVHNPRITLLIAYLRKQGSGIDMRVLGYICIGSPSRSENQSGLEVVHDLTPDYCSNLVFPSSLSAPDASYFSQFPEYIPVISHTSVNTTPLSVVPSIGLILHDSIPLPLYFSTLSPVSPLSYLHDKTPTSSHSPLGSLHS